MTLNEGNQEALYVQVLVLFCYTQRISRVFTLQKIFIKKKVAENVLIKQL